jgi:outer membrane lipoprotein-sorting protein
MIEAQGGRKYLSGIQDQVYEGSIDLVQYGMSGTFTMYLKEPNKMRMDMEAMGMLISQGYDGQTAWQTNPQTGVIEELPADQAKDFARQAIGLSYLLYPEKFNIKYVLQPKAEIEGKEYIVIQTILEDGFTITQYIDPSTYLAYKSEQLQMGMTGVEVNTEAYPSDYRKVGETMAPHAMKIIQEGAVFMTMTFSSITYNNKLEDSLFTIGK